MQTGWPVAERALQALLECDPVKKQQQVIALRQSMASDRSPHPPTHLASPPRPIPIPGRPARPLLVPPRAVPRRRLHTQKGRAALIHAVAHIEFNAINLALDALYRFQQMPAAYYQDWLNVAYQEATHFALLTNRLNQLGYEYGDFEAHDGLWEMAVLTAHDPLVRMALVPRVLEARGLDVTPTMIERFHAIGDGDTAAILQTILDDEIGHVAIGSRWFQYLCEQRGVDPEITFLQLINQYYPRQVRLPLNTVARFQAGFTETELQRLTEIASSLPKH